MLCILPGQETYWRYPLHQRSTHWNVTVSKPAAVSFDCRCDQYTITTDVVSVYAQSKH